MKPNVRCTDPGNDIKAAVNVRFVAGCCSAPDIAGHFEFGVMVLQGVVITDPHLIAEVLQSKEFEKDVRTYRTLDSVSLLPMLS